jgi:hypothetical protein
MTHGMRIIRGPEDGSSWDSPGGDAHRVIHRRQLLTVPRRSAGRHRAPPRPPRSTFHCSVSGHARTSAIFQRTDGMRCDGLRRPRHAPSKRPRCATFSGRRADPPRQNLTIDLGHGQSMDFIFVRPGSFIMGSPATERSHERNEEAVRVESARASGLQRPRSPRPNLPPS